MSAIKVITVVNCSSKDSLEISHIPQAKILSHPNPSQLATPNKIRSLSGFRWKVWRFRP